MGAGLAGHRATSAAARCPVPLVTTSSIARKHVGDHGRGEHRVGGHIDLLDRHLAAVGALHHLDDVLLGVDPFPHRVA